MATTEEGGPDKGGLSVCTSTIVTDFVYSSIIALRYLKTNAIADSYLYWYVSAATWTEACRCADKCMFNP